MGQRDDTPILLLHPPAILIGMQADLETATVDVAYVDGYVKKHGFIAW